jgi:hypothetical protein
MEGETKELGEINYKHERGKIGERFIKKCK